MKKKFLVTTFAIASAITLSLSGCGGNDNKEDSTIKESTAVENDNSDNNDTDEKKDNDNNEAAATDEPGEVVATETPDGAKDYSGIVDGDGNDISSKPTLEPPSLDDFQEGAYFDENGQVCFKESDGSIAVLWTPQDGLLDNSSLAPDNTLDSTTPTFYTKEDEALMVADDQGNIVEYLDSSDEEYVAMYKVSQIMLKCACCSAETRDEKQAIIEKNSTPDYKPLPEATELKSTTNYLDSFVEKAVFNKDKTKCRVKSYVHYEDDASGTMEEGTAFIT